MNKTNIIVGLSVLVVILLFVNFSKLNDSKLPSDYNEYTAGQLLDVKIGYDEQIQELKDKRQGVIDLYNVKRGRVNTGSTVVESGNGAIELVNEQLGL